MKDRALLVGISLIVMSALVPSEGFSQVQAAQNRIPQQIVINGQTASGAYVTTSSGQIQSFTCPSPQHYATSDGNSEGWACYEQTTGVWLLNSVAPSQSQVAPLPAPAPAPAPQVIPQQAPPVYQQAPPVYQQAPPVYQQAPPLVYQQAPPVVIYPQTQPAIIYPQAPPTVIYQQPPAVIYQPAPTVVYAPAPRPVVVGPVYPSSVVLGRAAIEAAGRVASAAIISSNRSRDHYYYYDYDDHDRRHHDRNDRNDRNHGHRW